MKHHGKFFQPYCPILLSHVQHCPFESKPVLLHAVCLSRYKRQQITHWFRPKQPIPDQQWPQGALTLGIIALYRVWVGLPPQPVHAYFINDAEHYVPDNWELNFPAQCLLQYFPHQCSCELINLKQEIKVETRCNRSTKTAIKRVWLVPIHF